MFVQAASISKPTDSYLGLLYTMEDVAVYGYMTPAKTKIVLAFALSDSVVKDAEVITVAPPLTHHL
jgi:trafficking protein particle complex subunit 2